MDDTERFLEHQSGRLATTWRRVQHRAGDATPTVPMLDGVIEPFLRELAATLGGAEGSAWSRTQGVLRLAPSRGVMALQVEFKALALCLAATLSALGTPASKRTVLNAQVRQARDAARALMRGLLEPDAPPPRVPFGGLVVECFEVAPPKAPARAIPLH